MSRNDWFCKACGAADDKCTCLDDGMPTGDVTGCEDDEADWVDARDVYDIEYDH